MYKALHRNTRGCANTNTTHRRSVKQFLHTSCHSGCKPILRQATNQFAIFLDWEFRTYINNCFEWYKNTPDANRICIQLSEPVQNTNLKLSNPYWQSLLILWIHPVSTINSYNIVVESCF